MTVLEAERPSRGAIGSDLRSRGRSEDWVGSEVPPRPAEPRSVLLVSPEQGLRQALATCLEELLWQVRQAHGGAEAMMQLRTRACEAMLVDSWLPDLEAGEFAAEVKKLYPSIDVLRLDTAAGEEAAPSPRRSELLHAVSAACRRRGLEAASRQSLRPAPNLRPAPMRPAEPYQHLDDGPIAVGRLIRSQVLGKREDKLPELVGSSAAIREVARLVALVAPRSAAVLIEGETGTGKELVARALHRLSRRAAKPFAVLNCAAIPESLLEAELFGHARGAFTGAVQSRTGRIEMADGGTLLLDEIGEMPLGMQAKMLRFLESGELQRVGENKVVQVDIRLIAATHQPLERRSAEGSFRLDLYHRLAVFPIEVPPLRDRMEDIASLAEFFLERSGCDGPRKYLSAEALEMLERHNWPGNVRELMHVLERGAILAGPSLQLGAAEIRYRRTARS